MKRVKHEVEICIEARTPAIIWGPPGVGKTAMMELIAQERQAVLFCPTVYDPSDVALPIPRDEGHEMSPARWAREAIKLAESGREVIIFLDELTTKPPAVQAALLRFLDSGLLGDYKIPESVARIAAANPPEEAVNGWNLQAPVANRLVHLEFDLDIDDWISWMLQQGTRGHTLVASFIKVRPHLLFVMPQDESARGRAWPSPRSWDWGVARRYNVLAPRGEVPEEDLLRIAITAVGEGAGLEFGTWVREANLPDPEALITHPETFQLPKRGDLQFAVLAGVVQRFMEHETNERWLNAWAIMAKACEQGAPDIAATSARFLVEYMTDKGSKFEFDLPLDYAEAFAEIIELAHGAP